MNTAICTIFSKNYLARGRVLAESLARNLPGLPFIALLVDRIEGYFDPNAEPFDIVTIDLLPIPDRESFCFKYSILELNTAAKPFFLQYLFQLGWQRLIYVDPDTYFVGPMDEAIRALDTSSILLTPHRTEPRETDDFPTDRQLCLFGTFNLGFLGLRADRTTKRFLAWWAKHLYSECLTIPWQGWFVDQRWIDLVPSYFDGVEILRHPGYNVARWNLLERSITRDTPRASSVSTSTRYLANGEPCRFFHFSNFDPERPEPEDWYGSRDVLMEIFGDYGAALIAKGEREIRTWPYAFDHFDNGVEIPPSARLRYLELGEAVKRLGDPFRTAHGTSYYRWLMRLQRPAITGDTTIDVLRRTKRELALAYAIWRARKRARPGKGSRRAG